MSTKVYLPDIYKELHQGPGPHPGTDKAQGTHGRPEMVIHQAPLTYSTPHIVARDEVPRLFRVYAGAKWRVADIVFPLLKPGTTFVEPFCGGASLSYLAKRAGFKTLSGDASYYAYMHALGGIVPNKPRDVTELQEKIWSVKSKSGYLTAKVQNMSLPPSKRSYFPVETAQWIDGFSSQYKNDPLLLSSLGLILDTLRPPGGVPGWTNRVPSLEFFKKAALRIATDTNSGIREGDSKAFFGPGDQLLKTQESFKDHTLYLDPAWPFSSRRSGGHGSKVASIYYHPAEVGAILRQQETPLKLFGGKDHTDYILGMIDEFKRKGGDRVIVATQSSNYPDPYTLSRLLTKRYGKPIHVEKRRVAGGIRSSFAKKSFFTEYWLVID